jgi:hypothetical protein
MAHNHISPMMLMEEVCLPIINLDIYWYFTLSLDDVQLAIT